MADKLLFDKSMQKIVFLLRCSGVNIAIGKSEPTETKKNRIIYILNFIWFNTDVIGAVCWFISGVKHGESFTDLTYVAPCLTLSFLADIKSILIIVYEKNLYNLIRTLRDMEVEERNRRKSDERTHIIKKEVNFLNMVVSPLYVLNMMLVVSFALEPLALMALKYVKTKEVELLLPFRIVYPFDAYNINVWPFVYVRQIWSEIVAVFNICAVDFMFYNFCSYITIQFRLLQYDIKNLITDTNGTSEDVDSTIQSKLIAIIKWHQELIRCVELLETIYSKSTLYNFVSSSILICLTGFNVTENKDIVLVMTFLTFLFMGLLQIFFLCFFGDMLINASLEVSDAVYNSKWYFASTSKRRSLLLILNRAQSPCRLTAFGFADVSLRAFMKILSTSWSYFALLKTVYRSE